jgi:hypothetical protein
MFTSVEVALEFLRSGPLGYAATPIPGVFDGVELEASGWAISSLHLDRVESSLFGDTDAFPPGTAEPDSAFLMAGLRVTWFSRPNLRVESLGAARV